MKKLVLFTLFALLVGCSSNDVMNIENNLIPTKPSGEELTLEEIQKSIVNSLQRRRWQPKVISADEVQGRLNVRDHWAQISITFNRKTYSINYLDSKNLDYKNGSIHRNYNNWVLRLDRTIQQDLNRAAYNQ